MLSFEDQLEKNYRCSLMSIKHISVWKSGQMDLKQIRSLPISTLHLHLQPIIKNSSKKRLLKIYHQKKKQSNLVLYTKISVSELKYYKNEIHCQCVLLFDTFCHIHLRCWEDSKRHAILHEKYMRKHLYLSLLLTCKFKQIKYF